MASPPRTRGQLACLVMAWMCWIAILPFVFFFIDSFFDPGPHGLAEVLRIPFGFLCLVGGGLGALLYVTSRTKPIQQEAE